jgi:hypothetical protein
MSTVQRTALTLLLLSVGTVATSQPSTPRPLAGTVAPRQDLIAIAAFERRVDHYVTLHRLLESSMPPLQPTTKMDDIYSATRELARRIQSARPDARQGDIITPEVGRVFRRRIATCLSPDDWAALFEEMTEDAEDVPTGATPRLQVNMEWPSAVPFEFVPPQLLLALPSVPAELEYRIIGRSLVLWDHHANLIVDILPDAFTT